MVSKDSLDQGDLVKLTNGDEDFQATIWMLDIPTKSELRQMQQDGEMTRSEAKDHPVRPDDSPDDLVLCQSGQNDFAIKAENIVRILKKVDDREMAFASEQFRFGGDVPDDALVSPDSDEYGEAWS